MSRKLGTIADRWKRYRARHLPYVVRPCVGCGSSIRPKGKQVKCSACRTDVCGYCQKPVPVKDGRQRKFCGMECKNASQRGVEPQHLALNRGRKPRTYHLRYRDRHGSTLDREWRTAVFERDNYTCQHCGQRGGRLQADHIKPFKAHPELRHVLSNGRTLCVECHRKTDTYGWANHWRTQIAVKRLSQEVLDFS